MTFLQKLPLISTISRQFSRTYSQPSSSWRSHSTLLRPCLPRSKSLLPRPSLLQNFMTRASRSFSISCPRDADAYKVRERCKIPDWGRPCPICYQDKHSGMLSGSPCLPWAKKGRGTIARRNSSCSIRPRISGSHYVPFATPVSFEEFCSKLPAKPGNKLSPSEAQDGCEAPITGIFSDSGQIQSRHTLAKTQAEVCKNDFEVPITDPQSASTKACANVQMESSKDASALVMETGGSPAQNLSSNGVEAPAEQCKGEIAVANVKIEAEPSKDTVLAVDTGSASAQCVSNTATPTEQCQGDFEATISNNVPSQSVCYDPKSEIQVEPIKDNSTVIILGAGGASAKCISPTTGTEAQMQQGDPLSITNAANTQAEPSDNVNTAEPDAASCMPLAFAGDPATKLDQLLITCATLSQPFRDPYLQNEALEAKKKGKKSKKDPCKKKEKKKDPCKKKEKKQDPCKKKKDPCKKEKKKDPCKKEKKDPCKKEKKDPCKKKC